ncbi:MAG: NUDIX domain-containing protein [Nesterenkonia sp.]|uniref:NUDIX hydrolase n=1 Tax=Nesterenkonia marinintestina TaxID=2979865 RepID=UPI0021BFDB35|nr:NUDIX domain-containing protein [Nesterenkonia sp. GX14115]MDO5493514.1 NUDIX domain-containing protein [Nesterenkonia sp.]
MDLRVGAYAVITEGGKLLLPHLDDEVGIGWTLPGGGLEPGEPPDEAALREVLEETGYDVELTSTLGVRSFVVSGDRRLRAEDMGRDLQILQIIYRARVVSGMLRVESEGSTDDVAWHDFEAVDSLHRVSLVDHARRLAGLPVGEGATAPQRTV